MAWHGMAWHGMAWYGMKWYGMDRYGVEWYGMAWHTTGGIKGHRGGICEIATESEEIQVESN
jgi:hypothetical protein